MANETTQQSTTRPFDTPAVILTELVDRDGNVVTMPTFRRPTDEEWRADTEVAAELNAQADEAEINWKEDNRIGVHWFCSADGGLVTIHVIGTGETATCTSGHRWLRTFGEHDGWIQVP